MTAYPHVYRTQHMAQHLWLTLTQHIAITALVLNNQLKYDNNINADQYPAVHTYIVNNCMNKTIQYELKWLLKELEQINYSDDAAVAAMYELGLLRAIITQCILNDNMNKSTVRSIIASSPYNRNTPL